MNEMGPRLRALLDSCLAGIAHDLNGRTGAVSGIAGILRDDGFDADVVDALEDQARRLAHSVRQISLLSVSAHDAAIDIGLAELVWDAVTLYGCRAGPEPVEAEMSVGEATAVHVSPGLARSMLVLLLAAAELPDGPRGPAHRLRLHAGRSGDSGSVRIARDDANAGGPIDSATLGEASELAASCGAVIEIDGRSGWPITVSWPAIG